MRLDSQLFFKKTNQPNKGLTCNYERRNWLPIVSAGELNGCQGYRNVLERMEQIVSAGELDGYQGSQDSRAPLRGIVSAGELDGYQGSNSRLIYSYRIISAGEMNVYQTIIPPPLSEQCIIMNQRCFPTSQRERYSRGLCGVSQSAWERINGLDVHSSRKLVALKPFPPAPYRLSIRGSVHVE